MLDILQSGHEESLATHHKIISPLPHTPVATQASKGWKAAHENCMRLYENLAKKQQNNNKPRIIIKKKYKKL